MRTFKDQLALGLTLKGAATKVVAGGDIKSIDLHLTSWGWSGSIEFDIFDDDDPGLRSEILSEMARALQIEFVDRSIALAGEGLVDQPIQHQVAVSLRHGRACARAVGDRRRR